LIDDTSFKNLLVASQVLSTKDFSKWNFDILLELFEGPLLNPERLNEAMRISKFVRNLMKFFHPKSGGTDGSGSTVDKGFRVIKWTKVR
jgi:rapamycin-insensitive companion of mTOR